MKIDMYIIFNGNCRESVEFYSQVFNTPIQETFWSKCYGMVVDKFGIWWQFNLLSKNEQMDV